MISADDVRNALTARAVLDFYGWKVHRSGDELESSACPQRADHSRRALVINANTGRWQCFPCGISGDLFDFIALVEKLRIDTDFPAVIVKAAAIAGVGEGVDPEERERHRRARADAEERERTAKAERARAAIPRASYHWSSLLHRHERGEAYLTTRGCAAAVETLVVRFELEGSPALPLHDSDGHIRNVVARRLPELGEPKTPGLPDCPTPGTLAHSVTDIESGADVVVTEGVFDSITAVIAWKRAVVLGAHGAGNLPKVVQVAAPAVKRAGGRLLLIPHQDRFGYQKAREAIDIAHAAGLSIRDGSLQIVKTGAKDLNAAWLNGWRPCA